MCKLARRLGIYKGQRKIELSKNNSPAESSPSIFERCARKPLRHQGHNDDVTTYLCILCMMPMLGFEETKAKSTNKITVKLHYGLLENFGSLPTRRTMMKMIK